MPTWVMNEMTVAGPRGPVEAVDEEVWSAEKATSDDGSGFQFHVAVPAVPAGSGFSEAYPSGDLGGRAWGCRAVGAGLHGAGRRHERTVISSVDEWVNAHRYHFYLQALEDVAYSRLETAGKKAPPRTEDAIRETMTAKDAPHLIRYRFDTAYAAPERFVQQLAGRYPQLYFRLTWEGECSEVHGMAVHAPIKHEWRGESMSIATENCTLAATENCTLHGRTSRAGPYVLLSSDTQN